MGVTRGLTPYLLLWTQLQLASNVAAGSRAMYYDVTRWVDFTRVHG